MGVTSERDFRIAYLADVPGVAPVLERWFVAEWAPWYGPDGPGDAKADLTACCNRDELPICLVALSADGEVLGTAALKAESVGSELAAGPWLAAVLVNEAHRGRGIGTALVEAIEAEAARLGFGALYTSTDTAGGILERRAWQAIGDTGSLRGRLTVYRRQIGDGASPG